jgi:hypothetical protein
MACVIAGGGHHPGARHAIPVGVTALDEVLHRSYTHATQR